MIVIQGHFDSAFVVDPMLSEFTMNPTKVYPPQLLQKSNCVCREQHLCHEFFDIQVGYYQREQRSSTVCSEGFLYKVAPPELKTITNYVFCHPQFSGVIQNIENHCAILTPVCLCRLLSK